MGTLADQDDSRIADQLLQGFGWWHPVRRVDGGALMTSATVSVSTEMAVSVVGVASKSQTS